MKRKLALLMAAVMTLTLLPSMNVFGASSHTLSHTPNVLPKKTIMYEEGVYRTIMGVQGGPIRGRDVDEKIEYAEDGTDLIIKISGSTDLLVGQRFRLDLQNAKFFFRGNTPANDVTGKLALLDDADNTGTDKQAYANDRTSTERWAENNVTGPTTPASATAIALASNLGGWLNANGTATSPAPFRTWDPEKGMWEGNGSSSSVTGRYIRYGDIILEADAQASVQRLSANSQVTYTDDLGLLADFVQGDQISDLYDAYKALYDEKALQAGGGGPTGLPWNTDMERSLKLLGSLYAREIARLASAGNTAAQIPYTMDTERSTDNSAVVTILPVFDTQRETNVPYRGNDNWEIRIPMVVRTDGDGEVKVSIKSDTAPVTDQVVNLFSQTTTGVSTKAYADDITIARNDFDLETFYIAERRLNSIANEWWTLDTTNLNNGEYRGTFTLRAPTGFEWKDPNRLVDKGTRVWNPDDRETNLGLESGLEWLATNVTLTNRSDSVIVAGDRWSGLGYSGEYRGGGTAGGIYGKYASINRDEYFAPYELTNIHNDYRIFYKDQGLTSEDRQTLVVELYNAQPSTSLMGKLYIEGLGLTADDNAKFGDVLIEVRDDRNFPAGVSNETNVKVAERKEWDIILRTVSDIPTLVNGRYNKVNPLDSTRVDHQTARVRFEEASVNAWWADRQTVFSLPEWAKFRMVDFVDGDKFESASDKILFDNLYTSNLSTAPSRENNVGNGIFINDGEKHGAVTINGNTMTLDNLRVQRDERAWFEMDMWISIESGRTGDVQLGVSGSAIPVQSNGGTVAPITIAKAVNPVNVTAKITDVKIGYQYQPTYDIIITETAAGMLEKDKAVYVSVSDLMSTDMQFSPDTRVAVTGGNLKLRNISNTAIASTSVIEGTTVLAGTGGTISFNIDMASSQASTITVSNVSVKVDRTVPETNKYPYKAIAWGPAVAPNYIYYEYVKDVRDKHNVPGIMADYIKVVSSANDKASILSQEVRVTIGETFFSVNGVSYDMDAAAYISTASNSTMVPVRFISNAFGISNDQVIWDNGKKTVTIVSPVQIVQFTAGSSTMLLDGSAVTMYSPDNLEVMAEIVGDRCYVPFRAMGQAFGIPVEWDDATQTAIYNPGAYSGTAGQAAADETTATTGE